MTVYKKNGKDAWSVDDVMAAGPCERYDRGRVEELFGGELYLTVEEIAQIPIGFGDRLWALVMVCMTNNQYEEYENTVSINRIIPSATCLRVALKILNKKEQER